MTHQPECVVDDVRVATLVMDGTADLAKRAMIDHASSKLSLFYARGGACFFKSRNPIFMLIL